MSDVIIVERFVAIRYQLHKCSMASARGKMSDQADLSKYAGNRERTACQLGNIDVSCSLGILGRRLVDGRKTGKKDKQRQFRQPRRFETLDGR